MLNDKYFEMAFADELHKRAKSDEFAKEALLGVKALLKGVQTYGKGVAKGVQSKLIKAKVGLQTGGKVTPNSYKVDAIGRITTKPGTPKKYIKQLEKAKTLERGGKSLRGKGAPKKVWPKMKAEAKADINTIKSKLPGTKVVKQTKKSPGCSSATFISAEEKLRSGAKKFKKNLKNQA